jgi:hypothetical protein
MPQREVIVLSEENSRLEVPQSGDTYLMPRDVSIVGDATVSGTINGQDITQFIYTGDIDFAEDKDYILWFSAPFNGTITRVYTKSELGTATFTIKINDVASGGTPNNVSTISEEQIHSSDNEFVTEDKLSFTLASVVDCENVSFIVYGVRT